MQAWLKFYLTSKGYYSEQKEQIFIISLQATVKDDLMAKNSCCGISS